MTRHGLLLLDKPSGPTSHDVVAILRRASGERRVGHAGTLDPLASGLLLVCLGSATRICEYLVGHDKHYSVTIRLGVATSTYDAQGDVTHGHAGRLPPDEEIERALASFRGAILQAPPPYSAVKVAGVPLYRLARRGEAVAAAPRMVTVYSLEWSRPALETIELRLRCSSGTYVRSLAHDLGLALGCGAHVTSLRRTAVGSFGVEQAVTLDAAREMLALGDRAALLPIAKALEDMPKVAFDADSLRRLRLGQAAPGPPAAAKDDHVALDGSGEAVGIVRPTEAGLWRPRKVFSREGGE